jgi:tRNA(fMet)-specific endonuclease VapC
MPPSLLDTDTISEVMKGVHPIIRRQAQQYLDSYACFTFSILTRYEILRGLKAKQAIKQIALFENRCQVSEVLPLTDPIIVRGANIYADLKRRGRLISDADVLIASTAMIYGLVLITNNLSHFSRIPGLVVETWRIS